jgi:hypothetical protein
VAHGDSGPGPGASQPGASQPGASQPGASQPGASSSGSLVFESRYNAIQAVLLFFFGVTAGVAGFVLLRRARDAEYAKLARASKVTLVS